MFDIKINKTDPDHIVQNIPKTPIQAIWYFVCQSKAIFIALIGSAFLLATLCTLVPYAIGQFVEIIASDIPKDEALSELLTLSGSLIVLFWLIHILDRFHLHLLIRKLPAYFGSQIWWQLYQYTIQHSTKYFFDDFAGRIATKLGEIANSTRHFVADFCGSITFIISFMVVSVGLFGYHHIYFSILALIWLISTAAITLIAIPKLVQYAGNTNESYSQVQGQLIDIFTNITTVKLFGSRAQEDSLLFGRLKTNLKNMLVEHDKLTTTLLFIYVINMLFLSSVVILSIYLWYYNGLTPGAVATLVPLAWQIVNMSDWAFWTSFGMFSQYGKIQDGLKLLIQPYQVTDKIGAKNLKVTDGVVTFDQVKFHYGQKVSVLPKLSLTINSGEKVGLVGPSGAGKSTLMKLLLRLYDVEGGSVMIDGHDLRDIKQHSLRQHIGVVTQEPALLNRSIADNIAFGLGKVPRKKIIAAAKAAHAHDFILGLQDGKGRTGYDAHVGERGVKLSGGQRQRISIARVILKDAPILILDEATSALDSEIESAIQDSLAIMMHKKTVMVIAHRLSTLKQMDRIVVMDKGKIVEEGKHSSLIKRKNGLYARLWSKQSGGFV